LQNTIATGTTKLELRLVGDITGRFFVPAYQRGYRWGPDEVEQLLEDVWENGDRPYCLQPVVVKARGANEWELVDGQQRLTTLYLVFLCLQRAFLPAAAPPWTLVYETRPRSEAYLATLDASEKGANIDFFHMYRAFEKVQEWIEGRARRDGNVGRKHFVAMQLYRFLYERVQVIWYEADAGVDARTLFARLNIGRIPLTNGELVKATLIMPGHGGGPTRPEEVVSQWDLIERDLRSPDLWAFLTNADPEAFPTRIELLLDLVAGGPRGRERKRFQTFDVLRARMISETRAQVWQEIVDLHAVLREWFDDHDLYHWIGFLIATDRHPDETLNELVPLAKKVTKQAFRAALAERTRQRLHLRRNDIGDLTYETSNGKERCTRVLLLFNVETVRRLGAGSERYSFRAHKGVERAGRSWSLEHIHAQQADGLRTLEQWTAWLRDHQRALATLPVDTALKERLDRKIESSLDKLDRHLFAELAEEVSQVFTPKEDTTASEDWMHGITNLALLPKDTNSALGNAAFEVKRRLVLGLDRDGAYIPVCTRRVFLKYYTDEGAQLCYWSATDRTAYHDAMFHQVHGVLTPYLLPEVAR
jgi:hypothetical protein